MWLPNNPVVWSTVISRKHAKKTSQDIPHSSGIYESKPHDLVSQADLKGDDVDYRLQAVDHERHFNHASTSIGADDRGFTLGGQHNKPTLACLQLLNDRLLLAAVPPTPPLLIYGN